MSVKNVINMNCVVGDGGREVYVPNTIRKSLQVVYKMSQTSHYKSLSDSEKREVDNYITTLDESDTDRWLSELNEMDKCQDAIDECRAQTNKMCEDYRNTGCSCNTYHIIWVGLWVLLGFCIWGSIYL